MEDDTWGARRGKLYIITNRFHQTGHFGGASDLSRALDATLEDLSRRLRDLQRDGMPKRVALAFAAMVAVACAMGAWRTSGRLYERPAPRYARSEPLVAQGGSAGRAAVLAAPTTPRSLVAVEMLNASLDHLRDRLQLPAHASNQQVLDTIRRTGALDTSTTQRLEQMLSDLMATERAIVRSEHLSVTDVAIRQLQEQIEQVLGTLKPSSGRTL
jgi:hypothetical protein